MWVAVCGLLLLAVTMPLQAQEGRFLQQATKDAEQVRRDSLMHRTDSLYVDSLKNVNEFKAAVQYQATDSITLEAEARTMHMYGKSILRYEQQQVEAERIDVNYKSSVLEANGIPDTSDKDGLRKLGAPLFKDGEDVYETESMRYNFKTKVGKIIYTRTKQDENIMILRQTKRNPDESFFGADGKFTTCDHDPPHYYIRIRKAKVIPNKRAMTGPLYLVIEDLPLPLILPFGYIPLKRGRQSGVILPVYGQDINRGFFLQQLGYYTGLGENMDLLIDTDLYGYGTYRVGITSNYFKRYRARGSFKVDYAYNVLGLPGDPNQQVQTTSSVNWQHDQPINPTTRLSANVQVQTGQFNQFNAVQAVQALTAQFNSSISFQKTFLPRQLWNLTANINHSQNIRNRVVDMTLPNINLNRARWFPFVGADGGRGAWYEKIGVQYGSSLQGRVTISERNFLGKAMWDSLRLGAVHTIGVSNNLTVLKYFNLTQSISAREYWYDRYVEPTYFTDVVNVNRPALRPNSDTTFISTRTLATQSVLREGIILQQRSGPARAADFNLSLTLSTRIYGVVQTRGLSQRAFRHTITPSISYTLTPDFSDRSWGYYQHFDFSATGQGTRRESRFQKSLIGGPGAGRAQSIGFTLYNLFEMKWLPQKLNPKDTTRKPGQKAEFKYLTLLDNLGLSGSYNLVADSFKLSTIGLTARTALFNNKLTINYSGNLDPYVLETQLDSVGEGLRRNGQLQGFRRNVYAWQRGASLGRITSHSLAINFRLEGGKNKRDPKEIPQEVKDRAAKDPIYKAELEEVTRLREQYFDFNIPWSVDFSYNWAWSRPQFTAQTTQSLNASFQLQLTKKWNISGNTGWDFDQRRITFTTFNINRDLHCWVLTFSAVPFGRFQSYTFQINVKSSVLQDLRYQRRRNWQDRFTSTN